MNNHFGAKIDEIHNDACHEDCNTDFLKNRMKLCVFAVCLLWASSLRTSSFISSHALKVPPSENVYKICKSTARIILEEEAKFSQCVDRQLQQCDMNLNTAIELETKRVNLLSSINSEIINDMNIISKNCSRDGMLLHNALMGWMSESTSHALPLRNDETCSPGDREKLMSSVYDIDELKSEAMTVSTAYNEEGKRTIHHLADYVKRRMEYDKNYALSYIKGFELEVLKFVKMTPLPALRITHRFPRIALEIENLVDCTTLQDIPYLVCNDFFPQIAFGGHWRYHVQKALDKWLALGEHWRESHGNMMNKARLFFNKAKQAEVMFVYYWNSKC